MQQCKTLHRHLKLLFKYSIAWWTYKGKGPNNFIWYFGLNIINSVIWFLKMRRCSYMIGRRNSDFILWHYAENIFAVGLRTSVTWRSCRAKGLGDGEGTGNYVTGKMVGEKVNAQSEEESIWGGPGEVSQTGRSYNLLSKPRLWEWKRALLSIMLGWWA